jgi:hypothetical protein
MTKKTISDMVKNLPSTPVAQRYCQVCYEPGATKRSYVNLHDDIVLVPLCDSCYKKHGIITKRMMKP